MRDIPYYNRDTPIPIGAIGDAIGGGLDSVFGDRQEKQRGLMQQYQAAQERELSQALCAGNNRTATEQILLLEEERICS